MTISIFYYFGAILVFLFVALLFSSYVKASPSRAFIISGLSKIPRILIGKGGFKIPFLERKDELSLSQITIDINTKEPVPTKDFIEVSIDAVAIIQVSHANIQTAAKNYVNKSNEEIGKSVTQTLSGCLREAIGTVEFKELNLNRDAFSKTVMKNAETDITSLGLEILSCNIERICDHNGLIESLGADNTWRIKKEAAITKATSEREIRETAATQEQQAKTKELDVAENIAERENQLTIKKANLKKDADRYKADADAAYAIQEANQQKTINEQIVEAEIAKQIKLQTLTKEEVKVTENQLMSSVNKQAEAQKYKTEVNAQAELEKQRLEAEARLVIQQKESEAIKVKAEAERYLKEQEAKAVKAMAEAEAAKIQMEGKATADAIKAKGLAEAEALQKKAEAYEKFGHAAILDMVVKVLPEVTKNVAEPISAISSVNIYGSNGDGISNLSGNVPTVLAQTFDTLQSVGVPVKEMLEAKTKSALTDKNIDLNLTK